MLVVTDTEVVIAEAVTAAVQSVVDACGRVFEEGEQGQRFVGVKNVVRSGGGDELG